MRAVLEPADLHRYDELNDSNGGMRTHWRPLIDRLRADKSPDAVRRSLELTRRLVVENGVADESSRKRYGRSHNGSHEHRTPLEHLHRARLGPVRRDAVMATSQVRTGWTDRACRG